jgi:hypothetical protein
LLVTVLVYYFCIVGIQETNAAALKTIFDLGKINRIVTRVESVVPDLYRQQLPVVVVGELALTQEQTERLKRYPNQLYRAQVTTETFVAYRQVQLLNFFLGRDAVTWPTQTQLDAALVSQQGRRSWPAPESVYEQDGVIVILFESYGPNVPVTSCGAEWNNGPCVPTPFPATSLAEAFTGNWDTQADSGAYRYRMTLNSVKGEVSGSYSGATSGTLAGTIDDAGKLIFSWTEGNNTGAGFFVLSPDRNSFTGHYSNNSDPKNVTGTWTGTRM